MTASWPTAIISEDRVYRYLLHRKWDGAEKTVTFIGLNPSTADETTDDRTIRRCIDFTKRWGGNRLLMVNLFSLRSTDPSALKIALDPIGPENDKWLQRAVEGSDLVVAAWGNGGALLGRSTVVRRRYPGLLHALSVTKLGMPKHPLYVAAHVYPSRFFD